MNEPIGCCYDWCIDQVAPMTDPKNREAQNEELNLEQLEDAAGGILAQANQQPQIARSLKGKENKFMTNTFLKDPQKPVTKLDNDFDTTWD